MRTVTASEANRQFSRLLRDVAAGETLVVTSHGRPVATLAPHQPPDLGPSAEERARREQAWKEIEARLRSHPVQNLGRFDRASLYEDHV